ncbi:MAG: nitrate reductase, partial [Chloroflexi bacterium]
MTIVGLALLILRRLSNVRTRVVTSGADWLLLIALLVQVVLGFWVAFFYRWGSDWYLHTAVPWLISLVKLNPQIGYVTALPAVVKLHMLWGFLIIALFPFTRLVHLVTVPITYLWRPYQVVIWNRRARQA